MILGMIGTQTIIIVMVIALLIFGPQKLPEVGRQIGQALRELRKMSGDMTKALDLDQHVSMDTSYDYNSYSNYTDSSHYSAPMDQYGLAGAHDADHANPLALVEAPKSLTITDDAVDVEDGTSTDKVDSAAAVDSADAVDSGDAGDYTPDTVHADSMSVPDSELHSEHIVSDIVDNTPELNATSEPQVKVDQPVVAEASGTPSNVPATPVGFDRDV